MFFFSGPRWLEVRWHIQSASFNSVHVVDFQKIFPKTLFRVWSCWWILWLVGPFSSFNGQVTDRKVEDETSSKRSSLYVASQLDHLVTKIQWYTGTVPSIIIRNQGGDVLSSFTRNNPADMVEMVQKDDTTTWRAINLVRSLSWLVIILSTFILHHLLDIAWHQYPSAIGHWLAKVGCDERTVLQKVWGNYARWLEDDDQRWSIWQVHLWPGP